MANRQWRWGRSKRRCRRGHDAVGNRLGSASHGKEMCPNAQSSNLMLWVFPREKDISIGFCVRGNGTGFSLCRSFDGVAPLERLSPHHNDFRGTAQQTRRDDMTPGPRVKVWNKNKWKDVMKGDKYNFHLYRRLFYYLRLSMFAFWLVVALRLVGWMMTRLRIAYRFEISSRKW